MKHIKLYEQFIGEKNFQSDEIFFLWDETVDDGREGIEAGHTTHKGKRATVFSFDAQDPSAFEEFKKRAEEYLKKHGFKYDDQGDSLFVFEGSLEEASRPGRAWSGKLENLDNLFSWMYDKGILNKGEKGEKDRIFRQYYRWYNDGDYPAAVRSKGVSKWMGDDAVEKALEEIIEDFMKKILNKYTGKYDRREFHIDTLLGDLNTLENIVAGYQNRETMERGEPDPYGLLNYWGKKINTGDSEFEKMLGELAPLYKEVDTAAEKALGPGYENNTIAYKREIGQEKGVWTPDLEKKYGKMKSHMLKMHEILKTVIDATKQAQAAFASN